MTSELTPNEKRSLALKGKFFPHKNGNYSPSLRASCFGCGKVVEVRGKRKESGNRHYCMDCNPGKYKKGLRPWNYIGDEEETECDWCHKKVIRNRSQVWAYKNHFCSHKCNGLWKAQHLVGAMVYNWKGGYEGYYGETWERQSRLCRERDKNVCQKCETNQQGKKKTNMDVDHRVPCEAFNGDFIKANDLINLWCLCASCHTKKTNWQAKFGRLTPAQWEPLIKEGYPS